MTTETPPTHCSTCGEPNTGLAEHTHPQPPKPSGLKPSGLPPWESLLIEPTMPEPLLTDDEHTAIRLAGELARLVDRIVGNGPTASYDLNELYAAIHVVQRTIGAQAAARAYPLSYRLLGRSLKDEPESSFDPTIPGVTFRDCRIEPGGIVPRSTPPQPSEPIMDLLEPEPKVPSFYLWAPLLVAIVVPLIVLAVASLL